MFDATTVTDELEAINLMLSLIGEQPVTSLGAANTNAEVQAALMILRAETRLLCSRRWQFNTDLNVQLAPDIGTGHINVPTGAVRVARYEGQEAGASMVDVEFTVRGSAGVMKLYDRKKNTFVWSQTLSVDIVRLMSFDNMPEPARWYAWVSAGRKFQMRFDTSEARAKLSQMDEAMALLQLQDYEIEDGNPNFLIDNADTLEGWAR